MFVFELEIDKQVYTGACNVCRKKYDSKSGLFVFIL